MTIDVRTDEMKTVIGYLGYGNSEYELIIMLIEEKVKNGSYDELAKEVNESIERSSDKEEMKTIYLECYDQLSDSMNSQVAG